MTGAERPAQTTHVGIDMAEATKMTEVIAQGGFKAVEAQRRRLAEHGIRAEVVCPPGANPNG